MTNMYLSMFAASVCAEATQTDQSTDFSSATLVLPMEYLNLTVRSLCEQCSLVFLSDFDVLHLLGFTQKDGFARCLTEESANVALVLPMEVPQLTVGSLCEQCSCQTSVFYIFWGLHKGMGLPGCLTEGSNLDQSTEFANVALVPPMEVPNLTVGSPCEQHHRECEYRSSANLSSHGLLIYQLAERVVMGQDTFTSLLHTWPT
ncbi:hypothetical protein J6590_025200 [Homalodisca vitripennis]|nr:hypothetical protein J6590_025200 [Homalodisca vitripennis]